MMQKNADLYNLTQQVQGQVFYAAVMTHIDDETRQNWMSRTPLMNLKRGYAESPAWILVQALELVDEDFTVENFRRRAVYSSPSLVKALFELMASEQLLDPINGDYKLTEKGQAEADKISRFRVDSFDGFDPIDEQDIVRLNGYLKRIVMDSLESQQIDTWCLRQSRKRAPDNDAPLLAHFVQYGSDFNALRDDAHMTAFGKYKIAGHVWEAFNYVQSEQATSASELYEKLAYRGFYTIDWQNALNDLTARQWISSVGNDTYAITDSGQAVFEDVEARTNSFFYESWDVLTSTEFDDLITLMMALKDACSKLVAS